VNLRVHGIDPRSRANGPGVRFVVWLQGCTLGCPGCFNPATHATDGGREMAIAELAARLAAARVEGLSLSGGEPFQQAAGALALCEAARALGLSTLAFSGYTLAEIAGVPGGPALLAQLDVLVDGRYVAGERLATGLRGSANQRIHLLTNRYSLVDVERTPVAEIVIGPTGELVLTGVDPVRVKR
jgi:anaerobic ribonucleoside-triphosphate reductase activating protein